MFWQVTRTIQDDDVTSLAINISKIIVCLIMLFGIESFTEQEHRSVLEYLMKVYGADIKKIKEIKDLLKEDK